MHQETSPEARLDTEWETHYYHLRIRRLTSVLSFPLRQPVG